MPFLHKLRRWGINNAPHLQQIFDDSTLGVLKSKFDEKEKEKKHDADPSRFMQKLNSLYFPFTWKEVLVNPERVLMINGKMNSPEQMNYWLERI